MRAFFTRTSDAPAKARAYVDEELASSGAGDEVREVARLLVSELVTNAVRHGEGENLAVDVRCNSMLHVGVEDAGRQLPVPRSGTTDTSGRGLQLVKHLADGWGVERHPRGKEVWFTLRP